MHSIGAGRRERSAHRVIFTPYSKFSERGYGGNLSPKERFPPHLIPLLKSLSLKLFPVDNLNAAAGKLNYALRLKILEHTGNSLAGRADILGNLLVSQFYGIGSGV